MCVTCAGLFVLVDLFDNAIERADELNRAVPMEKLDQRPDLYCIKCSLRWSLYGKTTLLQS